MATRALLQAPQGRLWPQTFLPIFINPRAYQSDRGLSMALLHASDVLLGVSSTASVEPGERPEILQSYLLLFEMAEAMVGACGGVFQ